MHRLLIALVALTSIAGAAEWETIRMTSGRYAVGEYDEATGKLTTFFPDMKVVDLPASLIEKREKQGPDPFAPSPESLGIPTKVLDLPGMGCDEHALNLSALAPYEVRLVKSCRTLQGLNQELDTLKVGEAETRDRRRIDTLEEQVKAAKKSWEEAHEAYHHMAGGYVRTFEEMLRLRSGVNGVALPEALQKQLADDQAAKDQRRQGAAASR